MLTGIFALLLSIGFIVAGAGYVKMARRMRDFRSTPGKVLAREVTTVPSGNTREGLYGSGGGYMPKVRYRYVVDGKEHESDRMGFAARGLKKELAERALAAIGDEVVVWYDPKQPSDAYLERHSPGIGIVLIAGGVLGGLGAIAYLMCHRSI